MGAAMELRPLRAGEPLFSRVDAPFEETDSRCLRLRYAPVDPAGVVLLQKDGDGSRRVGIGLLTRVEGAHALGDVQLILLEDVDAGECQERMIEAVVALAKQAGIRRLRLRFGARDVSALPWVRRLQTRPALEVHGDWTRIEFPTAAFCPGRSSKVGAGDVPTDARATVRAA